MVGSRKRFNRTFRVISAEKGGSMKNWLITGASSGIGREIALAALRRGDRVAATTRKIDNLDFLVREFADMAVPLEADLTDRKQIAAAFRKAADQFGRIDILVNNAGYIQLGAMEETTEEEAREQMEVLFWAAYHMTKECVPHMRKNGGGTIVQMSSLGGIGGLPGNTMYAASKYALEGMSEALSREVAGFGIRVLIAEPGGIRTGIAKSVKMSAPISAYDEVVGPQRQRFLTGTDVTAKGDPAKCAEVLLKVLDMEKMPLRILMSEEAAKIGILIHSMRLEEAKAYAELSNSVTI